MTETLLDSELFGYEKGAFTGAQQAKAGLLESAQGGTVFLDEIGDMPDKLQVKLLRTIENREITRVGGTKTHAIDVRFIAATHRDLDAAVEAKTFREDLYYRLNSMTLTLPPLRERPEEIEALARQFLAEAAGAGRDKRRVPRISAEALAIMRAHSWRGNIRELRNVVEHALVLCEDAEITAEHLPVEKMRFARLDPSPIGVGSALAIGWVGRAARNGADPRRGRRTSAHRPSPHGLCRQSNRGGEGAWNVTRHAHQPAQALRHPAAPSEVKVVTKSARERDARRERASRLRPRVLCTPGRRGRPSPACGIG